MGTELGILGLYGILVIGLVVVQVMVAIPNVGMGYMLGAREEGRAFTGLAGRLDRAVVNCVFGMALFAPAVLILHAKGSLPLPEALLAAQLFLIARIVYIISYAASIPVVRTLAFVTATLATVYLYTLGL